MPLLIYCNAPSNYATELAHLRRQTNKLEAENKKLRLRFSKNLNGIQTQTTSSSPSSGIPTNDTSIQNLISPSDSIKNINEIRIEQSQLLNEQKLETLKWKKVAMLMSQKLNKISENFFSEAVKKVENELRISPNASEKLSEVSSYNARASKKSSHWSLQKKTKDQTLPVDTRNQNILALSNSQILQGSNENNNTFAVQKSIQNLLSTQAQSIHPLTNQINSQLNALSMANVNTPFINSLLLKNIKLANLASQQNILSTAKLLDQQKWNNAAIGDRVASKSSNLNSLGRLSDLKVPNLSSSNVSVDVERSSLNENNKI